MLAAITAIIAAIIGDTGSDLGFHPAVMAVMDVMAHPVLFIRECSYWRVTTLFMCARKLPSHPSLASQQQRIPGSTWGFPKKSCDGRCDGSDGKGFRSLLCKPVVQSAHVSPESCWCGSPEGSIWSTKDGRFCRGVECKRAHQRARVKRQSAEHKLRTGKSYNQKHRPKASADACRCGKPLFHGFQCRACGLAAKSAKQRVAKRRARLERKLARAARGTTGPRVWIEGACGRCGRRFTTRYVPARYCSEACGAADGRDRRRALERGAKLTPGRRHRVFEASDWHCRICNEPLRRDVEVPHPLAPTVDHIVALARGGAHGPSNWQAAHFLCNSQKRDLPA